MTQNQITNLQQIFQQAQTKEKYLFKLLEIGRKQGFQNFINRKQIWPFLLQLDSKKLKETPVFDWKEGMDRNSTDFEQLQKDADRSLSSMKTFESITKFHLKKKQQAVLAVLDSFFAKNRQLRYIQGFHDVASVFLILFGNSTGYYLMEKAGRTYFYDFLTFQFGEVGMAVSQIVYEIVTIEDPEFKYMFSNFEQTKYLTFILPWILTWFSHNFSSVKEICRIWDYLLCTGPLGVFYLTAGIILSTKKQLIESCEELDVSSLLSQEPSIQTFYQQQAKKSAINIQEAILKAMELQQKIQATQLEGYKRLNPRSMLRYQNFYPKISIHKKYHQYLKAQTNKKHNVKTAAKVIALFGFALVTIYVVKNYSKLKNFQL